MFRFFRGRVQGWGKGSVSLWKTWSFNSLREKESVLKQAESSKYFFYFW